MKSQDTPLMHLQIVFPEPIVQYIITIKERAKAEKIPIVISYQKPTDSLDLVLSRKD